MEAVLATEAKIQPRLQSLRERHADLEAQLHEEELRPLPDPETITALKREKLTIKDQIEELERPGR